MAQERRDGRDRGRDRDERDSEFVDKLVHINRVAKVVKGGRRFGFAALVVVGDQKGRVGFGHGKAREVPEAIRKATEAAKRALIRVPLKEGRTLHHDVNGRHGAGKVILRAAAPHSRIVMPVLCCPVRPDGRSGLVGVQRHFTGMRIARGSEWPKHPGCPWKKP